MAQASAADIEALIARIDTLEMKAAYQDQAMEDLNAAVVAQWARIDHLQRFADSLQDRLRDLQDRVPPAEPQDEPPPPHY